MMLCGAFFTVEIWAGDGAGCRAGKDNGARVDGLQGEAGYHYHGFLPEE